MQYRATGYLLEQFSAPAIEARQVVSAHKQIDELHYQTIKKARDNCLLAVVLEERLQLVLDNFKDWEVELLSIAQEFLIWRTVEDVAMQQRLTLDRRLTNVLTAFRLYLDQTDHNLSQAFGNPSPELEGIKQLKRSMYDRCFGYRFLEALRNHVQHCGLPVQEISVNPGFVGSNSDNFGRPVQYFVIPYTTFDILSTSQVFKKATLDEIKALGDKIDLRRPIRQYVSCIIELHHAVRNVFTNIVTASRISFSNALDDFSEMEGQKILHPKLECCNDSGEVEEAIELIPDFLERYDSLCQRSSNLV